MEIEGWKYYHHAAIPTTAPHHTVNLEPLKNNSIWNIEGGTPLLVRWQSEWDCGYETEWWYCIKDTPFDISALKSKRRYEINKGNKNFYVQKINPFEHRDGIYKVTIAAYSGWPQKYRPKIEKESFCRQMDQWSEFDVFGGFSVETNDIRGYALLTDHGSYVEFAVLRTEPEAEKLAVNAAMVAGILDYYQNRFDGEFYINDGSRAIRHETAFQDYLEKYFGFRKAYCRLNVKYKKGIGMLVKLLYPFRTQISSEGPLGSKISGILKMEEIRRSF